MDFDSLFRTKIEGMLIQASWVHDAQTLLGLEGVSQIWGDKAAWYIWLRDSPGPYCLAFEEGEFSQSDGVEVAEGRFMIKCYPYANHPSFKGFSLEEKALITGGDFDQTNTPRFEVAADIPESLFGVGSLSFLSASNDLFTAVSFDSLERLTIIARPSRREAREDAAPSSGDALVRDVPGWEIGFPLFRCLVGLMAFSMRRFPSFLGVSASPGFEYILLGDGGAELKEADTNPQRSVFTGFDGGAESKACLERCWRSRFTSANGSAFCGNPSDAEAVTKCSLPCDPSLLIKTWKALSRLELRSDITSTCGCGSHKHHPSPCLFSRLSDKIH